MRYSRSAGNWGIILRRSRGLNLRNISDVEARVPLDRLMMGWTSFRVVQKFYTPVGSTYAARPLGMRLQSRIVRGVLLMSVGTFFVAIIAIRFLVPPSGEALPSERTVSSDRPSPAASSSVLPPCPAAGLQPLQPLSQTGHHQVILTWNASVPAPGPDGKAVGYCLYRSQKPNAAKQNPICSDCEQVNSTPVVGTGCVDNLVLDNATYYYVVTAINANKRISASSNETPAPIPPGNQTAKPVSTSSDPFCRGSASSK